MTRRSKILLVDDDRNARTALAELLRDAGYDVATAGGEVQVPAVLETFQPDVVLRDERAAGHEAAWVGDTAAAQHVLMSTLDLGFGIGAPWVKKPIDLEALLALLARLTR